ncbi:MAG: HAD-IA family hydrolase [Bacteroidales bacterium]|nr:HAD-IA family hydrolase [Bacteroidales bacterium]
MKINNIIFDLCGPIITLDIELMNRRFHDYGVTVEKPYQTLRDEGLTKRYEAGLVSTVDFISQVRVILDCPLSDSQILDAWNTIIVEFPHRHIELLQRLKDRYKIFLLSNSDETNAAYFKEYMKHSAGFDILNDCFDEVFFSCDLHDRKPSPSVFQHIVDKHHLMPSETLVVDDCKVHCEGAASVGLQTHWLVLGEDICDLNFNLL